MNFLGDLWTQLMQYQIVLIIGQFIGIAFSSVIVQGLLKNVIIASAFPKTYNDKQLLKKVIYPILVLVQGSVLSFFLLTAINHIAWKIILGGLIGFSSTTAYSILVDWVKNKFGVVIDNRNTVISLKAGPLLSDSQDGTPLPSEEEINNSKGGIKK